MASRQTFQSLGPMFAKYTLTCFNVISLNRRSGFRPLESYAFENGACGVKGQVIVFVVERFAA